MRQVSFCEHSVRREYCTSEVEEADSEAGAVIEALDTLLYDTDGVRNQQFHMREQIVTRAFSFIEQLGDDGPGVERTLIIHHDLTKKTFSDSYNVQTDWRPLASGATDEEFTTVYAIDRYAANVQACMQQPTIVFTGEEGFNETKEQRSMTAYDHEQLHDELWAFSKRHDRERSIAKILSASMEHEDYE